MPTIKTKGAKAKRKGTKTRTKRAQRTAKISKRKPNAAMRPVQPDAKLAKVVGSKPLPRSELTKKLWDYVKTRGLKDRKLRTMFSADKEVKPVFAGKGRRRDDDDDSIRTTSWGAGLR
jgi:chromatin remodeling complex protein RSC6